jgi:hypothetical protein
MQGDEKVSIRINGSRATFALRPDFSELDRVLKGIALSDSPVLIRAQHADDAMLLGRRLHVLGQRRTLELSVAHMPTEAHRLATEKTPGTWLLVSVSDWTDEAQSELAALIASMDEGRLSCRIAAEKMPRIVVLERADAPHGLAPALEQRLAFFSIAAGA